METNHSKMNELLTAKPRILVLDSEPMSRTLMEAVLRTEHGYEVLTAPSHGDGLDTARRLHPDLLLLDVAGREPEQGCALCRAFKSDPQMRRLPIVLVTPPASTGARASLADTGADEFLAKPFNRVELLARVRALLKIKALSDHLDEVESVIYALSRIIEAREGREGEAHTERVVLYASALGRQAGLSEDAVRMVGQAAMLRDLGKIGVPDRLLQKRGVLSEDEQKRMQTHAVLGEQIIAPLRSTAALLPIVRSHHERVDGKGYPDGLVGEEIPLGARIVAIADAYDAMLSPRPYRAALGTAKALTTLQAGAGKQWDARLVALFIGWIESHPHTSHNLK